MEEAFPASLFDTPIQEEQFKQDAKRVRQPTPQLSLFEIPMYETITFRFNTVEEYFPEGTTGKQMQEIIMGLLRDYQERWHKEREQKRAMEQER